MKESDPPHNSAIPRGFQLESTSPSDPMLPKPVDSGFDDETQNVKFIHSADLRDKSDSYFNHVPDDHPVLKLV